MKTEGPVTYTVIDNIVIPDELIDLTFCQINKEFIEDEAVTAFAVDMILPVIQEQIGESQVLRVSANHVHIGTDGLDPHHHLPHRYAAVLYLMDAEGCLVLDPADQAIRIQPQQGRLVFFPAHVVHAVEASPTPELRIALVTNFE